MQYRHLLLIPLVTALTACGGGGGGGDSTPGASTNLAPSVVNQSYSVNQAETLSVNAPGVLENSSDPEKDDLSAQVVSGPSHGALTLNTDGSFNYVHNGNSTEADSFTYLASDGTNSSAPATVTLTVNGVPVTSDACLPQENLPGDLNDFVSDDNTQLTYTPQTEPTHGTLTLSSDGTVSYALNEDFRGKDNFTYMVDDNNGGTATGSVNIIVGKTRIMPLGDSITEGVLRTSCDVDGLPDDEQVGYRAKLLQNLKEDGYIVDFVGSQQHGLSATPPIADPDHEGVGGDKASDVLDRIESNLTTSPADIILLHVGTNDINTDDTNTTINDIEQILDTIDAWEGTNNPVTVLLSTIIERRDAGGPCDTSPPLNFPNANVATLNSLIANTVASRLAANDRIILVDQHSVIGGDVQAGSTVPTGLSVDGVHPTAAGYEMMANEWFNKLTEAGSGTSDEIVSVFDDLKCPVN